MSKFSAEQVIMTLFLGLMIYIVGFSDYPSIYAVAIFPFALIAAGTARYFRLKNMVLASISCDDNKKRNYWVKPAHEIVLRGSPGNKPGLYGWDATALQDERGILLWRKIIEYDEGIYGPRLKTAMPKERRSTAADGSGEFVTSEGIRREPFHPTPEMLKVMRDSDILKAAFRRPWDRALIIFLLVVVVFTVIIIYLIGIVQDMQDQLEAGRQVLEVVSWRM